MPKLELTDPFIKGHKPTEKSEVQYSDSKVSGLTLRVTQSGNKSFSYRYYINGREKRYTIGKYPTLKLAEARRVAREIAEKVSIGIDPQTEKIQSRDDLTIKELSDEFKEKHLPSLKSSTQTDYKERIDNIIVPALGNIIARKIQPDDVLDLLEEIAGRAPVQSNRIRAVLSSMYTFGQKRRYVKVNPILTIPKCGEENQRDRYYTEKEIRKIWAIVDGLDQPVNSLLKMLFITGQRLGETRMMKWEYIKDNVWTIPEELTKAKRTHTLPLPPLAVNILKNLQIYTGGSQYVFQSPLKEDQPITWIQWHARSIRDLGEEKGVPDFRIHDIRRTVATYMAELEVNRTVLGKVLNHKQLAGDDQVTARYDRHDYMKEKRQALNQWAVKLQSIISDTDISDSENTGATIYKMW